MVQKGSSDEESDFENNVNNSINLPKINNKLTKDNLILKTKTIRGKKSQLNTNNSNASLNNKK